MRNFWQVSNLASRKNPITCGPKANAESMQTEIFIKEKGASVKALDIICGREDNKNIITVINNITGERMTVEVEA